MRSTQGDDHTTEKTQGDLNIFLCVGSIMGFTTHIYKLRCKDTNVKESFIGHAAQPKSCQSKHKSKSNYSNAKLYQSIRENGGWDNWSFTVLEKFKYSYDSFTLKKNNDTSLKKTSRFFGRLFNKLELKVFTTGTEEAFDI